MRIPLLCLSLLLAVPGPAHAQDTAIPTESASKTAVQTAIARITEAYGGEALTSLKTVSLEADRRLAWPGHGQTGSLVEYVDDRLRKHFDLERKHGSVERWIRQNGNVYHTRYAVEPRGAFLADYFDMTAQPSERGGYWQWFNVDYRSSDLLVAHFLATQNPDVTHAGEGFVDGHPIDLLSFQVGEETPIATISVSKRDGLIRRLKMDRDLGVVTLLFAGHTTTSNVAYAQEVFTYIGDRMVEYAPQVKIVVDSDVGGAIALESGLSEPFEMVDQSEMTIEELAPGVYHVGQEEYSLFAKAGEGLIAVNGYAGLRTRYEALTNQLGQDLPLSHLILTHQHEDQIADAAIALEMGAALVVTEEAEKVLLSENILGENTPRQVLNSDDTIGPFKVFVRPTAHASQNAFVLHSASGVLVQEDHYHGLRADGASRIQPTARELHALIEAESIDVRWLLSGHARKVERWSVFDEAVKATSPSLCPTGRDICRNSDT